MKNPNEPSQGGRPMVVLTLVVILLVLLICPFILRHLKMPSKVVRQIPIQTVALKPAPVPESRPQQIAYIPVQDDGIAPETRAALERAGLHDVQFSSFAFTVKPRKPIIIGSALPKTN